MPHATGSRSTQARSGVFISYARADGEKFADVLLTRLEALGIDAWQDRARMEGGRDWWLQITEALDRVEFMALVMTPGAVKSETVRKEWRYARQEGVCVYPIKGTPDLDFNSLPRWMRDLHIYDLGSFENNLHGPEWQKFINALNTPCQFRRVPFMVGDLPEGFVQRPDEFDRLLKLLCDERREEPIAITAALRGAGGYGKTTLAKALCHDQRIQDAFDDGILWVTLGESPGDLTGRVEDLIVTLSDERPGFTTLDAAVNRLKELLADRDILLVIDDVWDRAHLNPFIQGGPRCARLITTRDLAVVPASAEKVRVDAMQQEEATALLAADLDQPLQHDAALSRELKELASRLGEWPLLLRLANSALLNRIENDQQSLRDAVNWVNKALAKRGLTFFDASNSEERHQAVAKTIGVSIDLLNDQERQRYGELAIFPEDVEIPLDTLEKLWAKTGGLDEFDTEELCTRLNRFSLLWSYDANRQSIRLHDVVRKFLIEQSPNLPSIHSQLLDAYRTSTTSTAWSEMSAEEPYLWDNLAHHLVDADRSDELVATVKDWRYLVAKTLLRKSLAVEADLLAAETIASEDLPLRVLRRHFVNFGHLLNRCENGADIESTLLSRLQPLYELGLLTADPEQRRKPPYFVPTIMLPDFPHPALVRTISGHAAGVVGCAVSADGTMIVSACDDGTLKLWDGRRGAERFTLSNHAGSVKGCAMSMDGTIIISASSDKTVKVWNGRTGEERFTMRCHAALVNDCAVSADGLTIVSASRDNSVQVWDGRSGVARLTLYGHSGPVNGCAVSADGAIIVSASSDKTVKVWDGQSGAELYTLHGHSRPVNGCALSADGVVIVSVSSDKTVRVWDWRSGAERLTLRGHLRSVSDCAVSADGRTIVSASRDKTVKVWDGWSGAELLTLSGHTGPVKGCAVSADGRTIVSASDDRTLKVWDTRSAAERVTLTGDSVSVKACAVSADGALIISASNDKTLKVWDGQTGAEHFTLSGHANPIKSCAVSADGATIISASSDKTLKVWDGRSGAECLTLRGHSRSVNDCAVSADGLTIASASWDTTVRVWDRWSGAERYTLRGHSRQVTACSVSADGLMIVSGSWDTTLKVWDGQSGAERFTLRGHSHPVTGCAVSADGATIVSASRDALLKIWDGRTGAERFTLRGHSGVVGDCAVSADGATIISVSADQSLKMWNGNTGECLATLHVDGPLQCCACSADGEIIAAAGARGLYFLRLVR